MRERMLAVVACDQKVVERPRREAARRPGRRGVRNAKRET
jgi:hypothetical protein